MGKGPSKAAVGAAAYLTKHPNTDVATLAKKFGLHPSAIYRSQWFKALQAAKVTA